MFQRKKRDKKQKKPLLYMKEEHSYAVFEDAPRKK